MRHSASSPRLAPNDEDRCPVDVLLHYLYSYFTMSGMLCARLLGRFAKIQVRQFGRSAKLPVRLFGRSAKLLVRLLGCPARVQVRLSRGDCVACS
jgi:hypothetical protein